MRILNIFIGFSQNIETAVIAKKKCDIHEKTVSWQNQEIARSRAGRPPAVQNRKLAPEVISEAKNADTPGVTKYEQLMEFSFFLVAFVLFFIIF